MESWKTISRKRILEHSKYLNVEIHEIQLPDGRIIKDWPWLVEPDYINVLAQTEKGEFLCFRQTKYAVVGTSLAPVGGYLEPKEDPLTCAKRELLEETGHEAKDWIRLGQYVADGNHGSGSAHLFLARNAHRVKHANADDLEEQELLFLGRKEVEAALAQGEFKVLAWATTVALALRFLDRH